MDEKLEKLIRKNFKKALEQIEFDKICNVMTVSQLDLVQRRWFSCCSRKRND